MGYEKRMRTIRNGVAKTALALACFLTYGPAMQAFGENCDLCLPAYNGDLAGVAARIARHAPVNVRDSQGWTPLLYAAGNQHEEVGLLLLEHGADANAGLPDSRTPLLFALIHKETKLVQALLDHKANASEKYSDGWTPLLLEAESPADTELMGTLLAHHADPNATTSNGWTALDLVLEKVWDPDNAPPLQAVQLLLSYRANPNKTGRGKSSPIVWAALTGRGHKEILALMIGAGADPNTTDIMGDPILDNVLSDEDPQLAFLLLKVGANWKIAGRAGIPMMSDACQAPQGRIQQLAEHGVDFNWHQPGMRNLADDSFCWTDENLRALVDHQLYLDAEMPAAAKFWGASPLVSAVTWGSAEQIGALLRAGADLPSPDRTGYDPKMPDPRLLFIATLSPNKAEAYEVLIGYGVDVLAKNGAGYTVLEMLDAINASNRNEPDYLKARELMANAVQARKLTKGFLITAMDTLQHTQPDAQTDMLKKVFLEGLDLYHRDPGSIELRTMLAEVATRMSPVPPTSPDALTHEKAAQTAYESAHTRSEMLDVALQYEQASALAPWVAPYYKNLCTVYELSGSYGRAKRNCAIYLASDPGDAEEIRKQMQRLQSEIEKAIQ